GGNRGSALETYRNLVIVFLLVGLWHGASWTFVAWGAYHGGLLIIERLLGIGRDPERRGGVAAQARTVLLVLLGWILFRAEDIGSAGAFAAALLKPDPTLSLTVAAALSPVAAIALLVGAASVLLPGDWAT